MSSCNMTYILSGFSCLQKSATDIMAFDKHTGKTKNITSHYFEQLFSKLRTGIYLRSRSTMKISVRP